MYCLTANRIKQDIFTVTVSQSKHVAHHGHDCRRTNVRRTSTVPEGNQNIAWGPRDACQTHLQTDNAQSLHHR